MNKFSNTSLKKHIIGQVIIGLVRDWLTKEVNRYLGFLAYELATDGTASAYRDDDPIKPFREYLKTIDNSQLLALLHAEGPQGYIEGADVLTELTGSEDVARALLKNNGSVLEELKTLFPETLPGVLSEAENLATGPKGAEARIKQEFDDAVHRYKTEGAGAASDNIRAFMTSFPEEMGRTHFNTWYREPIKETEVERLKKLYSDGRFAQTIIHGQQIYR